MEILVRFAFGLVVLWVMERSAPSILRLYAVSVLPWGEEEPVAEFNRRYGRVRLPRTALLVGAALLLALGSEDTRGGQALLGAALVVAGAWICAAGIHIWKAGRGLAPRDGG